MAKKKRARTQAASRRVHSANALVQVFGLSKAGTSIQLNIYAEQEKIGTLVIGRGSLTWSGKQWKHGRRFTWSQFAALMERDA
jgi:hypothetical protein